METVDVSNQIDRDKDEDVIILVIGVGGGGGNAVRYMWNVGIEKVDLMICNTDIQALTTNPVESKVCMGDGLGAGNDPEEGRRKALESLDDIKNHINPKTKMVFITAGMGGGTGTGASPVIAKLTREMGILTVGVVTTPLAGEGYLRCNQASKGIEELRKNCDSMLVIKNDNIAEMYGDLSVAEAFCKANEILTGAVKGIAEIITIPNPEVNVDFADVKRVMANSGRTHMSVAVAEGENRALEAAKASLTSPLLENSKISGAEKILINISVADINGLKMREVNTILTFMQRNAKLPDRDATGMANIIWGQGVKPELGDKLELVLVATGFDPLHDEEQGDLAEPATDSRDKLVNPFDTFENNDQRDSNFVLGQNNNRYDNRSELSQPAYKRRKVTFVTVAGRGPRLEVIKNTEPAPSKEKEEGKVESGNLFENPQA